MQAVELDMVTRDEWRDFASNATVVLPLGATEQHGGHLPITMDSIMCERIARGAARLAATDTGPFLIAPALPFGRSDHHLSFGGTVSLRSETYLAVLGDILHSLATSGARAVFAVNGHGGNDAPVRIALADAAQRHGILAGGAGYWTIAWDALARAGAGALGAVPGHAGGFETSLLLAVEPGLVRSDGRVGGEPRAATEDPAARIVHADHSAWANGTGTSDDSRAATAEDGARLLAVIEREVARALVEFHRRAHDTA